MALTGSQIVSFPEVEVSLVDAYLRGLPSDRTRTEYSRAVRLLDEFLADREVLTATRRDIEAWRAGMETGGLAASTIGKRMSAVSGLFQFAVDEGVIDRNPAARARRPKVSSESPRRGLSPAEVQLLLGACDTNTLVGVRDRVLVVILAVQGWRLSEALGLQVEDLDEEAGHKVATIRGKGGKICRVPLAAATWSAIRDWMALAGIIDGPVVVPVLKGGRVQPGRAMTQQSADSRIKLLAERAGISRVVHAHLFRHGSVTAALDAGVPLREVQDFARHADPRTTRRYDSHRQSLSNPTPHVLASKMLG